MAVRLELLKQWERELELKKGLIQIKQRRSNQNMLFAILWLLLGIIFCITAKENGFIIYLLFLIVSTIYMKV